MLGCNDVGKLDSIDMNSTEKGGDLFTWVCSAFGDSVEKVAPLSDLRQNCFIGPHGLNNQLSPVEFEKRYAMSSQGVDRTRGDSISYYLMHRYNWIRPHQLNGGLTPAQAEKKLNIVYGIS